MGRYTERQLKEIFESGEGICFYCGKRLYFSKYGKLGERGAWEVAHVHAKSRGGSDTYYNLAPSCIECNRREQDRVSLLDNIRKYFKPSWWPVLFVSGAVALGIMTKKIVEAIFRRNLSP